MMSVLTDAGAVLPQKNANFIRMKSRISLVIADDHEIFRDGLALMLSKQGDLSLMGQAEDGNELIEMVERLKPDLVITDIKMPRLDGIAATRLLLQKNPD